MIRAVLTDIEGTTSSISFVKEVLFPYAAQHLAAYLRTRQEQPAVQQQLEQIWSEHPQCKGNIDATIALLQGWIENDEKRTPLKNLQGMIWREGYESGAYKAHIYPDAEQCLLRWQQQGLDLYVYSSGSIEAQKLFFRYSTAGDLGGLFKAFFDTTSGPKQSPDSYRNIVKAIRTPANEVLFLSDIEAELDAAAEAGLQTCWLLRPADSKVADAVRESSRHPSCSSFYDIDPQRF